MKISPPSAFRRWLRAAIRVAKRKEAGAQHPGAHRQASAASGIPLLQVLTHKHRFSSMIFLESAHHVLHGLNQRGMIAPSAEVMKVL